MATCTQGFLPAKQRHTRLATVGNYSSLDPLAIAIVRYYYCFQQPLDAQCDFHLEIFFYISIENFDAFYSSGDFSYKYR